MGKKPPIANDELWGSAPDVEADFVKARVQVAQDEHSLAVGAEQVAEKSKFRGQLNEADNSDQGHDPSSRKEGRSLHIARKAVDGARAIDEVQEATGMTRGQAVHIVDPKRGSRAPKNG
jgi:hypothetical protein